jgi:hypothetical protein
VHFGIVTGTDDADDIRTRFVWLVDQPPPSLAKQVEDAKARLARLIVGSG